MLCCRLRFTIFTVFTWTPGYTYFRKPQWDYLTRVCTGLLNWVPKREMVEKWLLTKKRPTWQLIDRKTSNWDSTSFSVKLLDVFTETDSMPESISVPLMSSHKLLSGTKCHGWCLRVISLSRSVQYLFGNRSLFQL